MALKFTKKNQANYSPTGLISSDERIVEDKHTSLLVVTICHELSLGLLGNPGLENIENLRLFQLKEKETPGWQFIMVYIPGRDIEGTDALLSSEFIIDDGIKEVF